MFVASQTVQPIQYQRAMFNRRFAHVCNVNKDQCHYVEAKTVFQKYFHLYNIMNYVSNYSNVYYFLDITLNKYFITYILDTSIHKDMMFL